MAHGNTIAIVHSGQETIAAALQAEVSSTGMNPVLMTAEEYPPSNEMLESASFDAGATAVLWIHPDGQAIDVWFVGDDNGQNSAGEVVYKQNTERSNALMVMKAVELLRARLVRIIDNENHTAPPEAAPPAESAAEETDRPRFVAIGLQPSATYGFGELPVTMHLQLYTDINIISGFGFRAFGWIPLISMNLDASEGSAEVHVGMIGGGVFYGFLPETGRFQLTTGLCIGAGIMHMKGDAAEDYQDGDDVIAFPAGLFSAGAAVSLGPVLSLRLDVGAGVAFKRPVVGFADRKATGWGRPILYGMLGLEVWLF